MDKTKYYFILTILSVIFSSCIHDDDLLPCTTECSIQIFVKDKNYSNVETTHPEEEMDENLPFDTFIKDLHYFIRDLATGQIVQEAVIETSQDNEMGYTLELGHLPYGKYELSVWGNHIDGVPDGILHKDNQEGSDIYLASTILDLSSSKFTGELWLARTKGKLVLFCNNFPDDVTTIEKKVDGVYETASSNFTYSGNTSVQKSTAFQQETEIVLSPSANAAGSTLNLRFLRNNARMKAESAPDIVLPAIALTLTRNQITVISADYTDNGLDISTIINGEWTLIHHLDIQ